jgi:hypothetical protein
VWVDGSQGEAGTFNLDVTLSAPVVSAACTGATALSFSGTPPTATASGDTTFSARASGAGTTLVGSSSLNPADLEAIAIMARRANAWVLSDEIYSQLVYEGDAPSIVGWTFDGCYNMKTVYYRPGTKGWGPTFDGVPTQIWTDILAVILSAKWSQVA